MTNQKLRVVQLRAENFKRLSAVDITPEGNSVVISGRNAQGKSSVLDSIAAALGGKATAKLTSRPIRDGEESASVTVDLGDLKVTRTWKGDKTNLVVTSADGAKYSSPQAMLDKLVGRLSFDPLAFAQQDDKAQLASLLSVVDLPFDPAELAEERDEVFSNRTNVNRDLRQLEARLAAAPKPPADLPDEELSAASVLAEYREAQEKVQDQNSWVRALEEHRARGDRARARLDEIAAAINRLRDEQVEVEAEYESAEVERRRMAQKVAGIMPIDLGQYEARLTGVEQTNAAVRAEKARRKLAEEVRLTRQESDALTAQLDEIDDRKAKAIREAAMPVDGLAFDDSGVTYNGVPFKQASAAEQLRVSVAMALALNPNVRVILIRDASLLDAENLRVIEEMAAERDAQIWLERVDDSGEIGIVIEDGQVREAVNG
jgi:DNA repair exonuclease SbcCD ATPase subunit